MCKGPKVGRQLPIWGTEEGQYDRVLGQQGVAVAHSDCWQGSNNSVAGKSQF